MMVITIIILKKTMHTISGAESQIPLKSEHNNSINVILCI